jgi:hypothetical protein
MFANDPNIVKVQSEPEGRIFACFTKPSSIEQFPTVPKDVSRYFAKNTGWDGITGWGKKPENLAVGHFESERE